MTDARSWVETGADDAHVHRERAKARALRQSAWWRAQLAKGRCHYCGGTFPPAELTMDHLVPVARGGRSERGNVVPCCRACNASKGCLTPAERILDSLGLADPAASPAAPPPDSGAEDPAP